jgi:hypothetical protein
MRPGPQAGSRARSARMTSCRGTDGSGAFEPGLAADGGEDEGVEAKARCLARISDPVSVTNGARARAGHAL